MERLYLDATVQFKGTVSCDATVQYILNLEDQSHEMNIFAKVSIKMVLF
jgi:hypothetical protein